MSAASHPSGPPGHDPADTPAASRGIPEATVARLPVYLRALHTLSSRSVATISSEDLAASAGVNSAKLRKDLSHLGSYGTRGVGYDVEYLVYQISRELGLTQDWSVAIIGVGNLGRALAHYGGFAIRGFRIAALLDADPAMVGQHIAGLEVEPVDALEKVIARRGIAIGVIATPGSSAQYVCGRLAEAGVTSVLNFAPVVLSVPPGVHVRKVDLSIELQILAFHEQRKGSPILDSGQLPAMAEPDQAEHETWMQPAWESGSIDSQRQSAAGHPAGQATGRPRPRDTEALET